MTTSSVKLSGRTIFPFALMLSFIAFLFVALALKVYHADRDLGAMQIAAQQAVYAAESGVHVGLQLLHAAFAGIELPPSLSDLSPGLLERRLPMDKWLSLGGSQPAFYRLARLRFLKGIDRSDTPLCDESLFLELQVEGRFGASTAHARATFSVTDLVKRFAVVNSLNTHYYGHPLRDWIAVYRGFENFRRAHGAFFRFGQLSAQGIICDSRLLFDVFRLDGSQVFRLPDGAALGLIEPLGRTYARAGESPCRGPLYCETPIILDTHRFHGPVQTGLYLFRRGNSQPTVLIDGQRVALPSSLRMQLTADSLEGDLPFGVAVDRDSRPHSGFMRRWRPDWDFLRTLAQEKGIYIDETGKGFRRGVPLAVSYHPEDDLEWVSENHYQPLAVQVQQDSFRESTICLSTTSRFDGRNNLSAEVLDGVNVVFSERSLQIRGDIGGDVMLVTPNQIFITGPTNTESSFRLFMLAKQGIALSTRDLEQHLQERSPDEDFIEAASTWIINAVMYNPGAGFFRHPDTREKPETNPGAVPFMGHGLSLNLVGACLEGDLQRWLEQAPKGGLTVTWQPEAIANFPVRPVSVNLSRLKIIAEN